jgi:hypothetical protein
LGFLALALPAAYCVYWVFCGWVVKFTGDPEALT